jgi:GNAT superfamily N-acetyltransferase
MYICEQASEYEWGRMTDLAFKEFGVNAKISKRSAYMRSLQINARVYFAMHESLPGVRTVVGMACISDPGIIDHESDSWWLTDVCVLPGWRGEGVGTMLVQHAIEQVQRFQDGHDHCDDGLRLACIPERMGYYKWFGFVVDEAFENKWDDTFVLMVKDI